MDLGSLLELDAKVTKTKQPLNYYKEEGHILKDYVTILLQLQILHLPKRGLIKVF